MEENEIKNQINNVIEKVQKMLLVLAVFVLLWNSFGTVGAGERGVRIRMGAVIEGSISEGLFFKIPFIEKIIKINIKNQKEQIQTEASSKDLQLVTCTVALNYHIAPEKVSKIYQDIGLSYVNIIIDPSLQESVKASMSKYTAEELITKREMVKEEIKEMLTKKLEIVGLKTDDFNIVNFNFSRTFNDAIEAKVTAEQSALASKNKLEQIKYEAQQEVEKAKGKAEAMRIEVTALASNPKILELRAIEKWNGILPQVTGGAVPFININNPK